MWNPDFFKVLKKKGNCSPLLSNCLRLSPQPKIIFFPSLSLIPQVCKTHQGAWHKNSRFAKHQLLEYLLQSIENLTWTIQKKNRMLRYWILLSIFDFLIDKHETLNMIKINTHLLNGLPIMQKEKNKFLKIYHLGLRNSSSLWASKIRYTKKHWETGIWRCTSNAKLFN